jgi:hypothetical protein
LTLYTSFFKTNQQYKAIANSNQEVEEKVLSFPPFHTGYCSMCNQQTGKWHGLDPSPQMKQQEFQSHQHYG